MPFFLTGRRRRSSLFQSLSSLASVALASAMGSPNRETVSSSESEDDDKDLDVEVQVKNHKIVSREDSLESGVLSFSTSQDQEEPPSGQSNRAFKFDEDTVAQFQQPNSVRVFKLI